MRLATSVFDLSCHSGPASRRAGAGRHCQRSAARAALRDAFPEFLQDRAAADAAAPLDGLAAARAGAVVRGALAAAHLPARDADARGRRSRHALHDLPDRHGLRRGHGQTGRQHGRRGDVYRADQPAGGGAGAADGAAHLPDGRTEGEGFRHR